MASPTGGDPEDAPKKRRITVVAKPPRLPPKSDLAGVELSQDGEVDPVPTQPGVSPRGWAPPQSVLRKPTLVPEPEDDDDTPVDPGSTGVFTKVELAKAAINAAILVSPSPAVERQLVPPQAPAPVTPVPMVAVPLQEPLAVTPPAPPPRREAFEPFSESLRKAPGEMRRAGQEIRREIRRKILEPLSEEWHEILGELRTAIHTGRKTTRKITAGRTPPAVMRRRFPEVLEANPFTDLADEEHKKLEGTSDHDPDDLDRSFQDLDDMIETWRALAPTPEERFVSRMRLAAFILPFVAIAIVICVFGLAMWYCRSEFVETIMPPSAAGETP